MNLQNHANDDDDGIECLLNQSNYLYKTRLIILVQLADHDTVGGARG